MRFPFLLRQSFFATDTLVDNRERPTHCAIRLLSKNVLAGFAFLLAVALPLSALAQLTGSANGTTSMRSQTRSTVLVGAGTGIPVHVVGSLSSGSAKAGDVFQIQINEDVAVEGKVVFRKGAGGEGHVTEADAAGGNGHSGAISLAFDYVYAADGGRVKLSTVTQKQAEDDRKGVSSTATLIGFATFGIGGLFGHNFAHGRQKTIDERTVVTVFVADSIHVQSNELAATVRYDN